MTVPTREVRFSRSYLYVPGDQPDKLARAAERGADALILDLEDAVAPAAKESARRSAAEWLLDQKPGIGPALWVRVNSGDLMEHDIKRVVSPPLRGIFVPKSSADALGEVNAILTEAEERTGLAEGTMALVALLESAAGILAAPDIAKAPRLATLALGEADLSAELGLAPSSGGEELLAIRTQVVLACAAAGIDPPIGPVSTDFNDLEALRRSTERLRRLGFGGRSAIHPAQVPVINQVFTPDPGEVDAARRLIEQHDEAVSAGKGAFVGEDGRMVDEAVVRAARRTLALAEALKISSSRET